MQAEELGSKVYEDMADKYLLTIDYECTDLRYIHVRVNSGNGKEALGVRRPSYQKNIWE